MRSRRQLSPQRIGQSDERELARAIRSKMRHRHFPADRGDVDDAASASATKVRKRLPDQVEGCPEMKIHSPLEILALHMLERTDLDDAGVIDYDVEAAEMGHDLLDSRLDLRAFEQVAGDGEDFATSLDELGPSPRQLVRIACEQGDPCALRAKLAREDQSQAARSAGDQDDLAGERPGAASRS